MATWQWANAKIDKKKSCIAQIDCTHFQGKYGRLQFDNVYTCHGILQRMVNMKKLIPKHFFYKLV